MTPSYIIIVITDDDRQLLQIQKDFKCFSSMVRQVVVKVKYK